MSRRNKIVLVGFSPSHTGDPKEPLAGVGSGHRLAKLCGLDVATYLRTFDRINLHYETPKKNDRVTRLVGEASASMFRARFAGRKIILLGKDVARAFGFNDNDKMLEWIKMTSSNIFLPLTYFALLPHPSGLNRWYNEPRNVRRAERFLRREVGRGRR